MKRILMLFWIGWLVGSSIGIAQDDYKKAAKELKSKAFKGARKEAKKWEKKGYSNLPGDPPLDKQFEESILKQFMHDESGDPLYIVTMGNAIAGTEGVASANAIDNARVALAGQVLSKVTELVSNNKASTRYNIKEIETIDEFISNSKTLIQQDIGYLKPVIRMFRVVDNQVEYRYSTIYSVEAAKNVAKRIMQDKLSERLHNSDTQDELDKLLGLD